MKKMKKMIFLAFLVLPFFVAAQETEKNRLEIGLNATQLLRNLFAQNPSGTTGRHTFFVKSGKGGSMFRLLVGGNVRNREEDFSGNSTLVFNSSELQLGLGFERRRSVYKKLELVVGVDLLTATKAEKSTSNFPDISGTRQLVNTRNSVSFGAGPILGLRYAFSDFFAISTESNIYLIGTKGQNRTTEDGLELTSKDFTRFEAIHSLPTNLFVVLTF